MIVVIIVLWKCELKMWNDIQYGQMSWKDDPIELMTTLRNQTWITRYTQHLQWVRMFFYILTNHYHSMLFMYNSPSTLCCRLVCQQHEICEQSGNLTWLSTSIFLYNKKMLHVAICRDRLSRKPLSMNSL